MSQNTFNYIVYVVGLVVISFFIFFIAMFGDCGGQQCERNRQLFVDGLTILTIVGFILLTWFFMIRPRLKR